MGGKHLQMCRIPDEFSNLDFTFFSYLSKYCWRGNTLVRDLRTMFSLYFIFILFIYLFFSGLRNQPGVARRRSRSNSDSVPLLLPLPLRSSGKTRNSVCPRMANCSDVCFCFVSSFPAPQLTTQVPSNLFPPCRTWIVSSRVDFLTVSGPFVSKTVTVPVSNVNRPIWKFNQDKKSQLAQVAMDAVKSPEANR